jgi:2-C-methyl-D-erythritol 2,4-cyclodiphosphate synthase
MYFFTLFVMREMEINIAQTLEIDPCRINIKATTTEGLGIIGKGEGIGAMSVVLLRRN